MISNMFILSSGPLMPFPFQKTSPSPPFLLFVCPWPTHWTPVHSRDFFTVDICPISPDLPPPTRSVCFISPGSFWGAHFNFLYLFFLSFWHPSFFFLYQSSFCLTLTFISFIFSLRVKKDFYFEPEEHHRAADGRKMITVWFLCCRMI